MYVYNYIRVIIYNYVYNYVYNYIYMHMEYIWIASLPEHVFNLQLGINYPS